MAKKDKIEQLYLHYEELVAKDCEKGLDSGAYKQILAAAKGSYKEKKLVCQFIPKFFHWFKDLSSESLNAYLDLCEDPDVTVRKEAIRGFPRFYNGEPNEFTQRFVNILSQMLLAKDESESSQVGSSLFVLLKNDPVGSLKGIFQQVKNGDDEVRDCVLKFLGTKIRKVYSTWKVDAHDVLVSEIKATFKEASPEEIPMLFGILLSTRLGKTCSGRKQILNMFLNYIEADKESLIINNNYGLKKFVSFLRNARALLHITSEIPSDSLFCFISTEVLPRFFTYDGFREGSGTCIRLLKLYAELATFTKDLKDTDLMMGNVLVLLVEFLPCPSLGDSKDCYTRLQFTSVECLLSVLHRLLKTSPSFFTRKHEALRDLRIRLLYFAKVSSICSKVIKEAVKKNTNEVDRIKMAALRTIANIISLLKDFFVDPPSPKADIVLSWLTSENSSIHLKRKVADSSGIVKTEKMQTLDSEEKKYKPPIGKYSQNLKYISKERAKSVSV